MEEEQKLERLVITPIAQPWESRSLHKMERASVCARDKIWSHLWIQVATGDPETRPSLPGKKEPNCDSSNCLKAAKKQGRNANTGENQQGGMIQPHSDV